MQNLQSIDQVKIGTNPLLTLLFFAVIVGGVIFSGSYFSQQRSAARLEAAALEAGVEMASTNR